MLWSRECMNIRDNSWIFFILFTDTCKLKILQQTKDKISLSLEYAWLEERPHQVTLMLKTLLNWLEMFHKKLTMILMLEIYSKSYSCLIIVYQLQLSLFLLLNYHNIFLQLELKLLAHLIWSLWWMDVWL